jgi:hypothetical protein
MTVSNKASSGVRLGRGGRCRKTNPISGSWPAGGIPSIPLFYHSPIPVRCYRAKRTQFGWSAAAAEAEMRKTNPISEEVSSLKCQVSSESCKTNPIPGAAGWDGASGATDAGKMRKTNPIPGGTGWNGAAGAWDAGRTCKTKPISTAPVAGRQSCRTKPICTAPAAQTAHLSRIPTPGEDKRAKQSQFRRSDRTGKYLVECAKRSQFSSRANAMDLIRHRCRPHPRGGIAEGIVERKPIDGENGTRRSTLG